MLALLAPLAVRAQRPEVPAAPATTAAASAPRGLRDRAELEAFLDGVMIAQLARQHVAGATVAVVKDSTLFFAKGYGYADVDARTPVDPARTLFRIGSVSKLFTWTAVMQLVEAGRLDLDRDVNAYIDFKIPATYPQPITLRNLLTHTPGFEEDPRDLISDNLADTVPLGRWLATHIPARVRPPGTYSSYSNYGTALAGYIVQRVSGEPWAQYVEQHVIAPLGMTHTSVRQPLPAALAADMSHGYQYRNGRFVPKKFEVILGAAPAGSISASATDMATFMLAHLGDGRLGDRRILGAATAERMHARAFGHDPRLPGFALGFYEQSSHGLRIIGHGGDTQWFHSNLTLIPSEHVGVFVSYNTDTGGEVSFGPFLEAFLDHYYPAPPPPVVLPADAAARAARVAGAYEFNRRAYTTYLRAAGLAGAVTVDAADDGSIVMHSPFGVQRLVPVGPLLYREALGSELVAFADSAGRITHGFVASVPMEVLDRLAWYDSPRLHQVLLAIAVVVFVATLAAAGGRVVRRRFGTPRPGDELPGRPFVVGLALAYVVFAIVLVALSSDLEAVLLGPATGLKIALVLPVIGAVLTIAAIVMAVRQWRTRAGTTGARLRYDAIVVLALLFAWSLNHWNLLGWRL
jgi:CubicO group peptidase (beta-lactamase class C family)